MNNMEYTLRIETDEWTENWTFDNLYWLSDELAWSIRLINENDDNIDPQMYFYAHHPANLEHHLSELFANPNFMGTQMRRGSSGLHMNSFAYVERVI